jgi:hypothetical protein
VGARSGRRAGTMHPLSLREAVWRVVAGVRKICAMITRLVAGPGAGYGMRSLSHSRTVWATSRQP